MLTVTFELSCDYKCTSDNGSLFPCSARAQSLPSETVPAFLDRVVNMYGWVVPVTNGQHVRGICDEHAPLTELVKIG